MLSCHVESVKLINFFLHFLGVVVLLVRTLHFTRKDGHLIIRQSAGCSLTCDIAWKISGNRIILQYVQVYAMVSVQCSQYDNVTIVTMMFDTQLQFSVINFPIILVSNHVEGFSEKRNILNKIFINWFWILQLISTCYNITPDRI